MASCIADGTVPGRNSVENERFARLLCDARNRHIKAYQGLQSAYRRFLRVISQDSGARRMNVPISIAHLRVMIKSCIEHKRDIPLGRVHGGWDEINQNEYAISRLDCDQPTQGRGGSLAID
jgi:hypothetical protein